MVARTGIEPVFLFKFASLSINNLHKCGVRSLAYNWIREISCLLLLGILSGSGFLAVYVFRDMRRRASEVMAVTAGWVSLRSGAIA
jgi:hypothetical protein